MRNIREIKFRVRDKSTKELLGYEYFNTSLNAGYYYIDLREPVDDGEGGITHVCKTEYNERAMLKPSHPLSGLLREQYTGLKDKNGVEIYEGDICVNENGRIARCVYHEPSASFDFAAANSIGDNYGYEPQMWKYKIAVIGNIYENPELLESNNE